MTDFLLELLTEEIPARMQAAASQQLYNRVYNGMLESGLIVGEIEVFVTPRRLVALAHDVAATSVERSDERRGPRADAPEQAIAGFLKSTGLARDALEERDTPKGVFLYATIATPGRPAADILADLIPAIVAAFDWPKSMRWGSASVSTASPRWVRPLSGIVALLGDAVVQFEAAGIASGRTTFGHRFLSAGPIEITSPATYADQLRAAHVMLGTDERRSTIAGRALDITRAAGLTLLPDAGLTEENAGLTEWPVPLLGRFDAAFLDVPREVIQLTMRTNQKYFACTDDGGALAPAFVCVANLPDAAGAIVAGNAKVLAARLSDAKFFWDADVAKVCAAGLASFTPKLATIVFHEKLGTVADKVERVAKLARWLVESGAVRPAAVTHPTPEVMLANASIHGGASADDAARSTVDAGVRQHDGAMGEAAVADLADLAETAARLCKADLVSATVGEFPEVQGIAGGHLALAEGLDPEIAAAIRDHYKPVGPSDDVPTAPVTVAVALADKLDTLIGFFNVGEPPTGSRDPFALRRAALGIIRLLIDGDRHVSIEAVIAVLVKLYRPQAFHRAMSSDAVLSKLPIPRPITNMKFDYTRKDGELVVALIVDGTEYGPVKQGAIQPLVDAIMVWGAFNSGASDQVIAFLADRLKVQQREAGIRPDVIDAVFSLGGEDDLVRLVARAEALQAVIGTPDGVSLLAGYRRGTNIVRIEEGKTPGVSDGPVEPDRLTEPAEIALNAALDAAVPAAAAAVAAEDFAGAMTALARLRPTVDAFFDTVTVNAHEQDLRRNRLALLARLRTAVHTVADFSKLQD